MILLIIRFKDFVLWVSIMFSTKLSHGVLERFAVFMSVKFGIEGKRHVPGPKSSPNSLTK